MTDTTVNDYEDEDDFDDFFERDLSQMFLDFVLFPLFFGAVASVLILVICGSLWGSFELVLLMKGMLA